MNMLRVSIPIGLNLRSVMISILSILCLTAIYVQMTMIDQLLSGTSEWSSFDINLVTVRSTYPASKASKLLGLGDNLPTLHFLSLRVGVAAMLLSRIDVTLFVLRLLGIATLSPLLITVVLSEKVNRHPIFFNFLCSYLIYASVTAYL